MNYNEIKTTALSYMDRTDANTEGNMDSFLRVIESRVNRKLRTMDMSLTLSIPVVSGQLQYDLPTDFGGLRQISHEVDGRKTTMVPVTPEMHDNITLITNPSGNAMGYFVDENQIKIPQPLDGGNIQILYYKNVPPLTATETNNWLSDNYDDCYIRGLCVEIALFVKDTEAAAIWEDIFQAALSEIQYEDQSLRWSGPSLQTRVM